jgi:hypothetical protein
VIQAAGMNILLLTAVAVFMQHSPTGAITNADFSSEVVHIRQLVANSDYRGAASAASHLRTRVASKIQIPEDHVWIKAEV